MANEHASSARFPTLLPVSLSLHRSFVRLCSQPPPSLFFFITRTLTALGPIKMSTPIYSGMPPPPRRHPLSNVQHQHHALNRDFQPVAPRQATPPRPAEKIKEPASPPLPRQNAKITPPSPPKVITDKGHNYEFVRVGMLGEVCWFVWQFSMKFVT